MRDLHSSSGQIPGCCCLNHHNHHSSGWWLTYPSEKWWSPSLGVTIPNWKVIKAMFQSPPTRYALDIPSGYDIHSSPWKIHPFFSSVNHLFLWAMFQPAIVFMDFPPLFIPMTPSAERQRLPGRDPRPLRRRRPWAGHALDPKMSRKSPVKVGIFGIYNPQKWGSMMI